MKVKYLKEYAWVLRGLQRKAVIQVMDKPKIPSQIHREAKKINLKLSLNNTSDALRSFVGKGIAKCLNPSEKVGRVYELTLKGKVIREQLL